jgi:hypothetical protein
MVEQLTLNQLVLGSSPSRGTISFFTTFFKNSPEQKVSKPSKTGLLDFAVPDGSLQRTTSPLIGIRQGRHRKLLPERSAIDR